MAYFQFRARAAEEEARPKNGMEMQVVEENPPHSVVAIAPGVPPDNNLPDADATGMVVVVDDHAFRSGTEAIGKLQDEASPMPSVPLQMGQDVKDDGVGAY